MKGKVLGFDPASGTGAITGDDGKRYKFTTADNKSPQPLKPNDSVDFEVDGDSAKDIYAVKTGFSLPTGGAAPAAGGGAPIAGGDAMQMILAKPYVIWAAVVILGSLIAGYLNALGALNAMSGPYGTGLGISALFIALLFAIPVIAGVLIFFEFTNNKLTPLFRLVTAGAAIGGPIVLPMLAQMTAPQMFGVSLAYGMGFNISVGMLITVAGGVLIVLTHLGILKLPTKLG